jgi:hypothetical protein
VIFKVKPNGRIIQRRSFHHTSSERECIDQRCMCMFVWVDFV